MERRKILIVDDEEDILRSTEMLLDVLGYECVTLRDPNKIVEVAARESPDLILQDLKMPGLDLDTVLTKLRSNPATENCSVALFSASPALPETAARFDTEGYLSKPFREEELVALLDRALKAHVAHRGTHL